MDRQLHGRGALFDTDPAGLAPRLVGLRPYRHLSHAPEHEPPAGPPFLVLSGARGLGKSAVLEELKAAYTGHTPVALIDCADAQFAAPPAERPAESWSPVAQALLVLAELLTEPVTGAGGIAFPRLMAGLLAVAAGGWRNADSERMRREVDRILLLNEGGTPMGFAGRWAGKVAAKVVAAATGSDAVLAGAIEATLESMTEGLAGRRHRREAQWYRTYPGSGDNAKRGLILLSGHFQAGGSSRRHAERHLVRALLADLTDAYTGVLPRMRRLGRPLVLLDNAQERAGRGLMTAVLQDRAAGFTDRTAFVAALRGDGRTVLPGAVRRTLPEVARRTEWAPDDAEPFSRALLVPLPPLGPDDALHIVGAICGGVQVPPRLPAAVHRLTGGNPLGIVLLAEAAAQHPERATVLGELLTAPLRPHDGRRGGGRGHGDSPAYAELLARLVPADRLDELTVLAAAHDHGSACALADALLADDFGSSAVRALQTRLAAEGLPGTPGQFVGDPFVRTLLLLRLHLADADHARWRTAHETLIAHCTPPGTPPDPQGGGPGDGQPGGAAGGPAGGSDAFRLQHELALGRTESAVTRLRGAFPVLDARAWLRILRTVASAPYLHAHDDEGRDFGGRGDRRTAVALGRTDARLPVPDGIDTAGAELHLRIRRLLHAVWQLSDPLVLPDPRVADRLRFELEQLSDLRPAGNAVLWRASRDWPAAALAGRPLPDPRTRESPDGGDGDDDGEDADDRNGDGTNG
ncbi:hypothetical protein [Streptomyces sp. NPDC047000]|uniref:hypothetical protein n=1 Tax=Streptomyces sp. NPDC047000 TaxID=3155474 RepID=UPI0033C6D549